MSARNVQVKVSPFRTEPARGFGNWAFEVAGEVVWFEGMFSQAKREAQKAAVAAGVRHVTVCP